MQIAQPTLTELDNAFELAADVTFETPDRKTMRIWLQFPKDVPPPTALGDPFLAGLVIPALSLGEDIFIDAPVSAGLLYACQNKLLPVLRSWGWGTGAEIIQCASLLEAQPPTPATGTASFFSSGVDSWHSVLKRRAELTHLIYIHGMDISIDNNILWEPALALTRESAGQLGLPLLLVRTNMHNVALHELPSRLEQLGRPFPYYALDRYFGSMLVAVATLLQERIQNVIIPSSWTYKDWQPRGSHWLLEPSLSTPMQRYELDGAEATRSDKVCSIFTKRPEAIRRLRVCFAENRSDLNCGQCEKCLRTMLSIRMAGGSDHLDAFSAPLDLDRIKKLKPVASVIPYWKNLKTQALEAGDLPVSKNIEIMLGERRDWSRRMSRMKKRFGFQ
ncbi:MAG: hypothetical protein JRC77_06255 [Deltaproteobacteria bacterium]|nr:hypothetical protein [Deltaproteobacteria bacterium]